MLLEKPEGREEERKRGREGGREREREREVLLLLLWWCVCVCVTPILKLICLLVFWDRRRGVGEVVEVVEGRAGLGRGPSASSYFQQLSILSDRLYQLHGAKRSGTNETRQCKVCSDLT